MIDILMPRGNEAELIALAEKLGFRELVLLYEHKKPSSPTPSSVKVKIRQAVLVSTLNEINGINQEIMIVAPAQREFFESKRVGFVIDAESDPGRDLFFQRRAGLDEAMCKLAKEKTTTLVFDLRLLRDNAALGRMMQNAALCRKYKLKTVVATFAFSPLQMRAPKDLEGFSRMLKLV
ncbi:MAG: hypothetical protein V1866_02700 [archaeon]